jgi:hypothetical protein
MLRCRTPQLRSGDREMLSDRVDASGLHDDPFVMQNVVHLDLVSRHDFYPRDISQWTSLERSGPMGSRTTKKTCRFCSFILRPNLRERFGTMTTHL